MRRSGRDGQRAARAMYDTKAAAITTPILSNSRKCCNKCDVVARCGSAEHDGASGLPCIVVLEQRIPFVGRMEGSRYTIQICQCDDAVLPQTLILAYDWKQSHTTRIQSVYAHSSNKGESAAAVQINWHALLLDWQVTALHRLLVTMSRFCMSYSAWTQHGWW